MLITDEEPESAEQAMISNLPLRCRDSSSGVRNDNIDEGEILSADLLNPVPKRTLGAVRPSEEKMKIAWRYERNKHISNKLGSMKSILCLPLILQFPLNLLTLTHIYAFLI